MTDLLLLRELRRFMGGGLDISSARTAGRMRALINRGYTGTVAYLT